MTKASAAANHDPAAYWDELLHALLQQSPEFTANFIARIRGAKLTFGDRVHCPFLRPFFLSPQEEKRVRPVAETIAELAERVANAAVADKSLFDQFHLRPEEERLARLPIRGRVCTTSRLDAFLLPDSLKFAEYNGEAPAGAGYSESLADIFRDFPIMTDFAKRFEVHTYPLSAKLLDALEMSYLDWGGTSKRPQIAIVDWKNVPTWAEFEILKTRFEKLRVPVVIADPRDLVFNGKNLIAHGKKIDLVYRRVLMNDIVARPKECAALVQAYTANAVCVSNSFRCKIPHVKAFFAVLTDERNAALFSRSELELIKRHVPWTRVVADLRTTHEGQPVDLLPLIRKHRENLVLKPSDEFGGTGVTLGWETSEHAWDVAIQTALSGFTSETEGCWIVQERIPIRREIFPFIANTGARGRGKSGKGKVAAESDPFPVVEPRDVLVDFAPFLFRGKLSGYLTRLSSTGLANVTSGGGQVPAFRVSPKLARPKKSAVSPAGAPGSS